MIGDVSGEAGMGALFLGLPSLIRQTRADLVVVNGENASGGFGLDVGDYEKIRSYGADVVTSGNHIWQKSEIYPLGRVDLVNADCPFRACREEAERAWKQGSIVLVDFHAENAQEKEAMGFHLDGIASAVVGTHTHVQTADEKILPGGCAYITDIGMSGVQHQVIGSKAEVAIRRQLTQIPLKSEVAEGRGELKGALITIDPQSRKALSIERI